MRHRVGLGIRAAPSGATSAAVMCQAAAAIPGLAGHISTRLVAGWASAFDGTYVGTYKATTSVSRPTSFTRSTA